MNIDTVVFDHSGTISDDFSIVHASANNILRIFGKSRVSEAKYRADFDKDIAMMYKKWGGGCIVG
ncbi:MAG: hypothetical protein QXR48_04145 [Candidatus Woesearchaeota archaeon]